LIKAENFNIPEYKPRILIAPLDWGLGHATRCIPIISALHQQKCVVIVAATAQIKILLQKEFPDLQFIELKGYRMLYSRYKCWMPAKLIVQLPKLIYRIYAENRWLKQTAIENNIDAVIADNRLGLYHTKIPCVYITHQLIIKTGNHFTEKIIQKIHYHFINKFNSCWVPDAPGKINLAGDLSHPVVLPKTPVTYLGPLSRFNKTETTVKYDLCIILSGPEPQRSIFEKILLNDLQNYQGKVFFLRGLPQQTIPPDAGNPGLEIINHLPASALNKVLLQSETIICRSGYTTLMDLIKLQKKAIVVPTPGQTEQEYLGRYLQEQKLFYCVDQKIFSLSEAINNAAGFEFNVWPVYDDNYKSVIENFTAILKINNADI
jgi:UDP-N-acetylglucosamine transferase subunit ALG13